MTLKTANINVRVNPVIKKSAEELFSSFGITLSDAINIFLNKSIMVGGLPFELKKEPKFNEETQKAIQEARDIISGKKKVKIYNSVSELFSDLDSDEI
jgi:DNA-damage-inducible protein J